MLRDERWTAAVAGSGASAAFLHRPVALVAQAARMQVAIFEPRPQVRRHGLAGTPAVAGTGCAAVVAAAAGWRRGADQMGGIRVDVATAPVRA